MIGARMPFEERLAAYASKPDECWIWPGAVNGNGYGTACGSRKSGRRNFITHRRAYELLVGPVPDGMHLDHLCRVRRCMNPRHLEPVTPAENNRRSESITAKAAKKTHCVRGHPLTPDNLVHSATGKRICKICSRAQSTRADLEIRKRRRKEGVRAGTYRMKGHRAECRRGHARTPENTMIRAHTTRDGIVTYVQVCRECRRHVARQRRNH